MLSKEQLRTKKLIEAARSGGPLPSEDPGALSEKDKEQQEEINKKEEKKNAGIFAAREEKERKPHKDERNIKNSTQTKKPEKKEKDNFVDETTKQLKKILKTKN